MSKLAVLYATTDGQTLKIASHIAARIKDQGHDVELHHVDALEDFTLAKLEAATDTSTDHEYTQWSEVNAFADAFVASLQNPATRAEVRS